MRTDILCSEFNVREFHEPEKAEVCAVEFDNVIIVCCYTQPSQESDILVSKMEKIYDRILEKGKKAIFVGDFNAHHKEWLNSHSKTNKLGISLKEFSEMYALDQIVKKPTRNDNF